MKGVGKLKVVLSWDDDAYCLQFKRGRDQENWYDLPRDEQIRAVGAMVTMAEMFKPQIKEAE